MEPQYKKRRLTADYDPDAELHQKRAKNDQRLKSVFESIFEKYEKDFEGIGDEIDLDTGKVVVNNGHLLGMTNEKDVGNENTSSNDQLESGFLLDRDEPSGESRSSGRTGTASPNLVESKSRTIGTDTEGLLHITDNMGNLDAQSFTKYEAYDSTHYEDINDDYSDELAINEDDDYDAKPQLDAMDHWAPPESDLEFPDEPAADTAWRVPTLPASLPKYRPLHRRMVLPMPLALDDDGDDSDGSEPRGSIWALDTKRSRQKRPRSHGPRTSEQVGLHLHDKDASNGTPYTNEENDLLRYLKMSTAMTYKEMEKYFPSRNYNSLGAHWAHIKARRKSDQALIRSPLPEQEDRSDVPTATQTHEPDRVFESPCTTSYPRDLSPSIGASRPALQPQRSCEVPSAEAITQPKEYDDYDMQLKSRSSTSPPQRQPSDLESKQANLISFDGLEHGCPKAQALRDSHNAAQQSEDHETSLDQPPATPETPIPPPRHANQDLIGAGDITGPVITAKQKSRVTTRLQKRLSLSTENAGRIDRVPHKGVTTSMPPEPLKRNLADHISVDESPSLPVLQEPSPPLSEPNSDMQRQRTCRVKLGEKYLKKTFIPGEVQLGASPSNPFVVEDGLENSTSAVAETNEDGVLSLPQTEYFELSSPDWDAGRKSHSVAPLVAELDRSATDLKLQPTAQTSNQTLQVRVVIPVVQRQDVPSEPRDQTSTRDAVASTSLSLTRENRKQTSSPAPSSIGISCEPIKPSNSTPVEGIALKRPEIPDSEAPSSSSQSEPSEAKVVHERRSENLSSAQNSISQPTSEQAQLRTYTSKPSRPRGRSSASPDPVCGPARPTSYLPGTKLTPVRRTKYAAKPAVVDTFLSGMNDGSEDELSFSATTICTPHRRPRPSPRLQSTAQRK